MRPSIKYMKTKMREEQIRAIIQSVNKGKMTKVKAVELINQINKYFNDLVE